MKRLVISCVFLLAGAVALAGQIDSEVKAGGISLKLPAPTPELFESADKLRTTVFELLVPSTNRLLAAFVPASTIEDSRSNRFTGALDVYAMVEVPRQAEYMDITPAQFAEIQKEVEPTMGSLDAKKLGQLEDELNLHLKSIDVGRIQMGSPQILGGMFQKPDACGYAMLMTLKQGERTATMAAGMGFLRVKNRLVYAYLFRKYESPETVHWLRTNLESWSDAILLKNK